MEIKAIAFIPTLATILPIPATLIFEANVYTPTRNAYIVKLFERPILELLLQSTGAILVEMFAMILVAVLRDQ